ncbi:MAG: polyprenyl synthetase family protein [Galbitalea sp.]
MATGLELFHAAALVHDDIMDRSDLRRGMPSAHRRFESLHSEQRWTAAAANSACPARCCWATCCSAGATSSSRRDSRSSTPARRPPRRGPSSIGCAPR